jgi:hypothetical protein
VRRVLKHRVMTVLLRQHRAVVAERIARAIEQRPVAYVSEGARLQRAADAAVAREHGERDEP